MDADVRDEFVFQLVNRCWDMM